MEKQDQKIEDAEFTDVREQFNKDAESKPQVVEQVVEQESPVTGFDGMSDKEIAETMKELGHNPGKHLSVYTKSKPSKSERRRKRKQQQASRKKNRGKTKGQKRSN